jgi:hypothetical protein
VGTTELGQFLVWWTGVLQREILDAVGNDGNPIINKWSGDSAGVIELYNYPSHTEPAASTAARPNLPQRRDPGRLARGDDIQTRTMSI